MSALPQMLLTGVLALAGAAGDDWPGFRGDPALNGVASGVLPAQPVLRWSFQAAKSIVSASGPVLKTVIRALPLI